MDHRRHARQASTGLLEGSNGEVTDPVLSGTWVESLPMNTSRSRTKDRHYSGKVRRNCPARTEGTRPDDADTDTFHFRASIGLAITLWISIEGCGYPAVGSTVTNRSNGGYQMFL